jgi:hypothetical protein
VCAAWRLSLIDLQQEGLGIMDELYLHAALTQFLFAPSLVINLLLQVRLYTTRPRSFSSHFYI